ncbi:MAG: hypothetical protein FWC32_07415 [Firmicutes bacterium]|nr:hypothetical protein [Bacillota bacterium]
MAETLSQEQRRIRPALEEFIVSRLSSEMQQDVLAFLDYCKSKKILCPWRSTNTWTMKVKGKSIGLIWLGGDKVDGLVNNETSHENRWSVGVSFVELFQYDDFIIKENLQGFMLSKIKDCTDCNPFCAPGYTKKILGETYRNTCSLSILDANTCINFSNPDAEAIEKVKRIIDFRLAILHGTNKRPIFDPATKNLTRIDNKLRVSEVTDLQGNPFYGGKSDKIDNLLNGHYKNYARFGINENSCNVVFKLYEPAQIAMYSFVTCFQLQVPNRWKFFGASSKKGPWVLLDEQNEFPQPVTSYTEKAFVINAPGIFQYYRLNFKKCKFDLSQVHLYTR